MSSPYAKSSTTISASANPYNVRSSILTSCTAPSRSDLTLALPERPQIPRAVRSHATQQNDCPEHQLGAHPAFPMCKPQPLWEYVRPGGDHDIESQKLSCCSQNRMYDRHLVVPLMKKLRPRRLYLLQKRGPHYKPDHHQIQE